MAKMMIDCSDPNDLKALQEAVERKAGSCSITYARQHQALVDAGRSKSVAESSRIIAAETGETFQAVQHRVHRGLQREELEKAPPVKDRVQPPKTVGMKRLTPRAKSLMKNALATLQRIDPGEQATALIQFRETLKKIIPKARRAEEKLALKTALKKD